MEIIKLTRLELGGGENPRREGFVNIDRVKNDKVHKVCDFEIDAIPYPSNTVDEIFCSHCLEHIENVKHFLNECHRVLKKTGIAKFIVPYGLWEGAQKPVHRQCITECWFDFLRRSNAYRIYGYRRWDITKLDILEKDSVKYEIICIMTPFK